MLNLKTKKTKFLPWTPGSVVTFFFNFSFLYFFLSIKVLAEVGTLQLEFCSLSRFTRNSTFCEKSLKLIDAIEKTAKNGVYSTFIDYNFNQAHSFSTMGGLGDSFYEYLLKMWLMTDKKIERFQTLYQDAIEVVKNRMIGYSHPNNLLYFKNIYADSNQETHTMEHLACFAGGMFGLGAREGASPSSDLEIAKNITYSCRLMYDNQVTKISPESVSFNNNQYSQNDFEISSPYYILRPETVESYFYLWRLTHDQKYRDWGELIFNQFLL
jgi:mannosyl-oligosaccharide alpha-1,2-mannosidase